jgi:hypothetical protein
MGLRKSRASLPRQYSRRPESRWLPCSWWAPCSPITAITVTVIGGALAISVVTMLFLVRLAARTGAAAVMSTGDDEG